MADPVKSALDGFARTILQIYGFNSKGNPPKPKPKVKPPAPGSIKPVGQTNLFSQSGKPRDFRNPTVSANRPPTTTPVGTNSKTTLNPGPTRPPAPGQLSLFGNNPSAKPSGNFKAPNVPKPGTGGFRPTAQALEWFAQQGKDAATQRALRSTGLGKNLSVGNGLGLQTLLMIANGVQDQLLTGQAKKNKEQWSIGGPGWDNAGPLPGQRDMRPPAQPSTAGPVGPFQTPEMVNNYYQDRNARHAALRADMPPVQPRSPASGAPVHAAPRQFASAYAPQTGTAARPNTPQPATPAANPFSGIGDVRGNGMGQSPVGPDANYSVGAQQYGGQSLKGIDQNGMDMERRRAFLDADNSLDGIKAVKDLLQRRKISISLSN